MRNMLVIVGSCALAATLGGCLEPAPECPDGMVEMNGTDDAFCVDTLEVTNQQAVEFLEEEGNSCSGHDCI